MHKSQSSVTYAVQQVQSKLGVKAFRIAGGKAVLTPPGELLYRRARYLLDEAAALEDSSKRLSAGGGPEISIAVEVPFPQRPLLRCLAKAGRESPHTPVQVVETVKPHRNPPRFGPRVGPALFAHHPP